MARLSLQLTLSSGVCPLHLPLLYGLFYRHVRKVVPRSLFGPLHVLAQNFGGEFFVCLGFAKERRDPCVAELWILFPQRRCGDGEVQIFLIGPCLRPLRSTALLLAEEDFRHKQRQLPRLRCAEVWRDPAPPTNLRLLQTP